MTLIYGPNLHGPAVGLRLLPGSWNSESTRLPLKIYKGPQKESTGMSFWYLGSMDYFSPILK